MSGTFSETDKAQISLSFAKLDRFSAREFFISLTGRHRLHARAPASLPFYLMCVWQDTPVFVQTCTRTFLQPSLSHTHTLLLPHTCKHTHTHTLCLSCTLPPPYTHSYTRTHAPTHSNTLRQQANISTILNFIRLDSSHSPFLRPIHQHSQTSTLIIKQILNYT
jgi:hypothetical protein